MMRAVREAWDLANIVHTFKIKEKATYFSPTGQERECVR